MISLLLISNLALAEEATQTSLPVESIETPEQETTSEESEPTVQIPLLYSGLDLQASLIRSSQAAKVSVDDLDAQTIVDLGGKSSPKLWVINGEESYEEDINNCTGKPISNIHIRTLAQTASNSLDYYELDKAGQYLKKAQKQVVCLQERFNADDVRKMYYLQGILEQFKGDNEASVQAFSSAIRIKPDLAWDQSKSPDAKPNFDQAKSEFSKLDAVPLDIIPAQASSSLWINGAPLLDADSPTIYVGDNIIQVIGLETTTYEISIPKDAEKVRLIIPSTTPVTANTWMQDADKMEELNLVLVSVLEKDTRLLVHDSGRIWETQIGSNQWDELKVPKFAETRLHAKKITGQALFWSGLVTSSVSLGSGINSYMKGNQAYQASVDTNDWDEFANHRSDLINYKDTYQVSVLVLAGGLGLSGLGYVWAF